MADELLQALIEAVSADHEVLGELGTRDDGARAYLARERQSRTLVVLMLVPGPDDEYALEVMRKLDQKVPEASRTCTECGTKLRPWARFCTRCGDDVSGLAAVMGRTPEEIDAIVQQAAGGAFEILGAIARQAGGAPVYFARHRASGKVSALALDQDAEHRVRVMSTQTLDTVDKSMPPPTTQRRTGRVSVVVTAAEVERVAAEAVAAAKPARHSVTATQSVDELTREEALDILGLDGSASAADIKARYEDLFSEYRVRETNAPTPTLRKKYKASLQSIESAGRTLGLAT
jgi:hypothetical protein